jgi:hypothetical protein
MRWPQVGAAYRELFADVIGEPSGTEHAVRPTVRPAPETVRV